MHLIIPYIYVKDDAKLLVSNMAKIKLRNNYVKNVKKIYIVLNTALYH